MAQDKLQPVWDQVESLLSDGLSLIPVRDKADAQGIAKSPYKGWKKYQAVRVSKEELWHQMDTYDTTAVAIICGAISGNLEVIDIDVKWKPGIEVAFFKSIADFRPDLWNKIRIHRSPSGGFHILYRIAFLPESGMPRNAKLARRPPTEEELSTDPKSPPKTFLETRAEAGYILAPPSLGYSIHQSNPVPLISWEDRLSLIQLARLLDEMPQIAPAPKRTRTENDYYTTSPWDAFNNSDAAERVLIDAGWREVHSNDTYTQFCRPGKDKGISASFIHSKRMFYVFTTNGGIDGDRGYHPSTLLSDLLHSGDRKATFKWLVQNGYGVINPKREVDIVRRAAQKGKQLPANASAEARTALTATITEYQEQYPHGVFWVEEIDKFGDTKIVISRERFITVASGLGFHHYRGDVVQILKPFVYKRTEREFFDAMKSYIKEEDADMYLSIADSTEAFLQRSGTFTCGRLPMLPTAALIRDTNTTAWKAYGDVLVEITANGVEKHLYGSLSGLIWAEKRHNRQYLVQEQGKYREFLERACEFADRREYVLSILGYLAHDYKDETTGYIIVLTEQCPDPKDGGGSGKNMFGNLLKWTTTYVSKAGSQTKFDEKFFQIWKGERVFAISDVPKHFDFVFLKEPATGSGVLKKLFKDEEVIPVEEMPKFIVQTNFSYDVSDGGLKRRIVPLEFTDFFTRAGGVDMHFGCYFPDGWSQDDWANYDCIITDAIQTWLRLGRKITPKRLTETGWRKQFEHTYGPTINDIIIQNIEHWCSKGFVSSEQLRCDLESYYNENGIQKHFWPSGKRLNSAMRDYCNHENIDYKTDVTKRDAFNVLRGRQFGNKIDELPF